VWLVSVLACNCVSVCTPNIACSAAVATTTKKCSPGGLQLSAVRVASAPVDTHTRGATPMCRWLAVVCLSRQGSTLRGSSPCHAEMRAAAGLQNLRWQTLPQLSKGEGFLIFRRRVAIDPLGVAGR
jgi:hypothetical protein